VYDSWNDSAAAAVDNIFQQVRKNPKIHLMDLRDELDAFINSLYSSPGGNVEAQTRWASIGADAIELSNKRDMGLTEKLLTTTLIRKQSDYGPENIRRFGRQGLMVRLHDKIARLENLDATGRSPANESVRDNLMDVVGYCAIGIMWESRTFLLPLRAA